MPECEVENRDQLLVDLGLEIDHHVPTGYQVELGERRIADDVLDREHHAFAQRRVDLVGAFIVREKGVQARRRDIGGDAVGIEADARVVQGVFVDVGCEDLDPRLLLLPGKFLQQQDRQRIGLLARRTAGHPHPHGTVRRPLDQAGNDLARQRFHRLGIAEEGGDADQQILEQQLGLFRAAPQAPQVILMAADVVEAHAPFDPADQRALLVEAEVVAGARPQKTDDLQHLLMGIAQIFLRRLADIGVAAVAEKLPRNAVHRQDEVRHPGRNRAARHAVVGGSRRVLDDRQPPGLLDRTDALGTIRPRAGKHDADRGAPALLGQRAEEMVDRHSQAAALQRLRQAQGAVPQAHVPVGRDDVDVVRLDPHSVLDLLHRQQGVSCQDLGRQAFMVGVEVLDQDEGDPGVLGHPREQVFEGVQTSGRSADSHHREGQRKRRWRLFGRDIRSRSRRGARFSPSL